MANCFFDRYNDYENPHISTDGAVETLTYPSIVRFCPDYPDWNVLGLLQWSPLFEEDTANVHQDLDIFDLSKSCYTTNFDRSEYSPIQEFASPLDWLDLLESNSLVPQFQEVETAESIGFTRRTRGNRAREDEDIFLYQLRDIKCLSWKAVATEFRQRTGKLVRIPALQMRVCRFRKRRLGISTKLA